MTALAQERLTPFAGLSPARGTYGIKANVKIYKGSQVAIDSAGRAMPAGLISTGALYAVGKASATYDNLTGSVLGGAADACDVEVEFGTFGWAASGIAASDVGKVAYVADDQTVALSDLGNTRGIAGIIVEYRDSKAWILQGPHVIGFLSASSSGAVAAGMAPTHLARYKAPGNVTLATFTVLQDGVTGVAGDRVLLANQTAGAENGIYVVGTVTTGTAALTRATDFNAATTAEIEEGVLVAVGEGNVAKDTQWRLTTNAPITVDTTALVFAFQSTAASGSASTAGNKSVRYVMTTNVADLTAFTVAQDGVTGVAGDLVLLANQTTPSQAGVYVIGTVTTGTAPLTRAGWLFTGAVVTGGFSVAVNEGTLNAQSVWFIKEAGQITIGTTSHTWYPEAITQSLALTAGTVTVSNVPILSVTKSGFSLPRRIIGAGGGAPTLTVGGYHPTVGGASGVTAGVVGTAALIIEATVGAGTINNADTSTLNVTIVNR